MTKRTPIAVTTAAVLLLSLTGLSLCAKETFQAYTDPAEAEKAGPGFALQGEYQGLVSGEDRTGVQVIALGDGKFQAVICPGGLPGDGWDGEKPRARSEGTLSDTGEVTFQHEGWTGVLKGGVISLTAPDGQAAGELTRVSRDSETLGLAPPEGATVLFDGTPASLEMWEPGAKMEGALLTQGAVSKPTFRDCQIHVEFRLPFMPQARGQARGNSGLYVAGRYEIQMLDSFGLEGKDNECGGIYKVSEPDVNMCYPPLSWQTYDVDYTAPRFNEQGEKTANARVTVRHNGVVIHQDRELPGPTGGAKGKDESVPGPIFLQNHLNPVRYRNVWVVEK